MTNNNLNNTNTTTTTNTTNTNIENNGNVQTKKQLNIYAVLISMILGVMMLVALYFAFSCPKVKLTQVLFAIFLSPFYLIYRAARPNC